MTRPALETARLILRFPEIADEPVFSDFMQSDRSKFVGGPTTIGGAWRAFAHLVGQWDMRGYGVFTMIERASEQVIGSCGFFHPIELDEPEIGWNIWHREHEGCGFASEAALACRGYAYKVLGWTTLTSNIDDGNDRSMALAERLGCTLERSYTEDHDPTLVHLYRHPGPQVRL